MTGTERQHARLLERPEPRELGDVTDRDVAAGATRLYVNEGSEFEEAENGGGTLRVRLSAGGGTDLILPYLGWGADDDLGDEWVDLPAGLSVAVPAGTRVDVWDVETSSPDVTYEGRALADDAPIGFPPREFTVTQALIDQLTPNGLPGADASVVLEREYGEDEWFLTEVLGLEPVIDLSYSDVDTAPPGLGGDSAPTDPPASSPALSLLDGPGAVVVRFTPVGDAQGYDLHVVAGAADGSAPTVGVSSATLHTRGVTPGLFVESFQDGTLLPLAGGAAEGEQQQPDAWFALVARNTNADGLELAAPASAWAPGRRGQLDVEVWRAGLLASREAVIDQVQTNGLTIADGTWNAGTGLRIPNVIEVPPNNSTAARLLAKFVARSLDVIDFLKIGGKRNEVSTGAEVVLASGAAAPPAPTVTQEWELARRFSDVPGSAIRGFTQATINGVVSWFVLEDLGSYQTRLHMYVDGQARRSFGPLTIDGRGGLSTQSSSFSPTAITVDICGRYYDHWHRHSVTIDASGFRGSEGLFYNEDNGNIQIASLAITVPGPNDRNWTVGWVKRTGESAYRLRAVRWMRLAGTNGLVPAGSEPPEYQNMGWTGSRIDPSHAITGRAPGSDTLSTMIFRGAANALCFVGQEGQWGRQAGLDFPVADGRAVAGGFWNSTGLHTIDTAGQVWRYNPTVFTGEVAVSYRDTDPAGTGLHETALSTPAVSLATVARGARARVTVTPVTDTGDVDSPDVATVYTRPGSSGSWRTQGEVDQTSWSRPVAAHSSSSATYPQHQSFANAKLTPAAILSQTGGLVLQGDGGGSVGAAGFRESVVAAPAVWAADFRPAADQSVSATTFTQVALTGEPRYTSAKVTRSGSDIVVADAGLYAVSANVRWPNNTSGSQRLVFAEVFTNEALNFGSTIFRIETPAGLWTSGGSGEVVLPAGGKVRLVAYHNATAALALNSGFTWLQVRRVG